MSLKLHDNWTGTRPQIRRSVPAAERFWPRVNKDGRIPVRRPDLGPCWVWTGKTTDGYGVFWRPGGRSTRSHIWAWEQENGPVPEGLEIDHLCFVHACVRPSHLEAVSHWENIQRAVAVRPVRTTCVRGHDITVLFRVRKYDGTKLCVQCRRDDNREYMRRKRAAR